MDRWGFTLANTDAPIPTLGIHILPESMNRAKTPEEIERYFSASFGSEILDDYVNKINLCMRTIRNFLENKQPNSNNILIKNSVFGFLLTYDSRQNCVKMSNMMNRPCAEAIGISRLFVMQLILCCRVHRHHLVIYEPTDSMILHLNSSSPHTREISREGGVLRKQIMLMSGDMESVNLRFLNVGHLLRSTPRYELNLNVVGFPAAVHLNNLQMVNERINGAKTTQNDNTEELISRLSIIPSDFLLLDSAASRKSRDSHISDLQPLVKRIRPSVV